MTDIQQTVYVVEDDEAVRDSLELLLKSDGKPVKTYESATAFLKDYSDKMAGCIVLDIRMPGMDGMELQKKLNEKHSILPIIFVTGHGDVPMAVDAMKEGAVDFIQKPYREEALLEKIEAALKQDLEQRKSLDEKQEIIRRIKSLTPREHEIMDRMIAGQANKVIAIELEISQRTVEIHRSRVMHKMGTHSLAHLVRMVLSVKDLIDAG
ncbi:MULTISPECIES: response regulator FixJ [Marinobacter]|jgi:FixJ family two-component response regulator|uniref:Response regulator n=4 Tax=Marinobacter TaxID=2742 RepID=A0A349GH43_9GAMM|nr:MULTISPECIES: response regulator FixJ [Marinobacter]MCP4064077.1 response regulator [Gammaproteobacteria bacterium]MCR9189500.1 response regulator FixJ [Alteromonadaceae bacterium]PTB94129.1 DNA-binding response regulator [Marinobacter sp. B9-2]ADP96817.1 two component transcriptional regulator, LuxR family [Marinobacter adhaerens HP15]AKV97579.1 histidine kinase [Marinobacter sp. CP1]|tara:strand:+ start:5128 stop:5754 length:627 start_codon:yes stop_codon:yes gene_type:complete|eukprot:gnl/TRDRNA2_/TRDRNA2_144212_c1_seq1.p2 gnl/TRDRNA2_/TRDRNA2_144212_c1~~gnl/TRDRNA2_/TRDRNA2_144212_c1_seq1.p2  ORF type:complete len:209 (-),score=53.55 gnl/TRDRNA2_/TRDRNA2_144212_c1_seq1:290-916(-)